MKSTQLYGYKHVFKSKPLSFMPTKMNDSTLYQTY